MTTLRSANDQGPFVESLLGPPKIEREAGGQETIVRKLREMEDIGDSRTTVNDVPVAALPQHHLITAYFDLLAEQYAPPRPPSRRTSASLEPFSHHFPRLRKTA